MLDNEFKKSATEKLKSMDSNDLKKAFKEIGSEPITNEEWFCSLYTEEKAKWIATQCGNAVMESTYDVSKLRKKRYWVEWLKQPHTPIS